jgi:hypothetical protein
MFAENLRSTAVHQWARSHLVPWGNDWHYLTEEELLGALGRFHTVEWTTTGFVAAFGRTRPVTNALARVDALVVDRITPANARYVMCGVANL